MLGENGERGRHVFVLDEDLRRDIEVRRREVPDGLDAVADQQVAHALRGGGRDCQDAPKFVIARRPQADAAISAVHSRIVGKPLRIRGLLQEIPTSLRSSE